MIGRALVLLVALLIASWTVSGALSIVPLRPAVVGQTTEFRVDGVVSTGNAFDPDSVRVDAALTGSTTSFNLPGFWHQNYTRSLLNGNESLQKLGAPEWRVRFTPREAGSHTITVSVTLNGQGDPTSASLGFQAAANAAPPPGFVGLSTNRQYFVRSDGTPLPLMGHCVCWHGGRGTYDYDAWFSAMHAAGENFARLWMCPWAFGIENPSESLTQYRLDRAWQLDYVFQLAEQYGIYLMLCLDYHGMFETKPDYWGGNNYWPLNPYNAARGGPCANPDAFFTSQAARAIYQKRLRYLIARYAASPNLLAWEFFNEIDNEYAYLAPANVAAWHAAMGDWLKSHDAYHHLVTTSLTGGSDRPDIWSLPQMDFAMYHSYNEPNPALALSAVAQSFLRNYRKPMMIGEFGVNWQGWNSSDDPYRRGLRQGIWAGVFSGSVGTSMSWYWESLHTENLYPLFTTVSNFVARTHLGRGQWQPVSFKQSSAPPATVASAQPNGLPFTAQLNLNAQWGAKLSGLLALPSPAAAAEAAGTLNAFVHGTGHPDLRTPFKVNLWLGTNASVVLHLNSVSDGAILNVRLDGTNSVFTRSLPNLDGTYQVNNEYNTNLTVNLPAGKHTVEIRNTGGDWFYLDWVRVVNALPASYAGEWQPEPVAIGLTSGGETLAYVASPSLKYPTQLTTATLDLLHGGSVTLSNWPAGNYHALWSDATTGATAGETQAAVSGGLLVLPLPDFREDLTARIVRQPALSISPRGTRTVEVVAQSDGSLDYQLLSSTNLFNWMPAAPATNAVDTVVWPQATDAPARFYRLAVP